MSYRMVSYGADPSTGALAGEAQAAQAAVPDKDGKALAGSLVGMAPMALALPPPASFIVAGSLVGIGAAIGIVVAVRAGKRKRDDIVRIATAAGIPDAAEVPAFTARAVKLSHSKLAQLAQKYAEKIDKLEVKGKRFLGIKVGSGDKAIHKYQSRLKIIAAADLLQQAIAMGRVPPPPMAPNLEAHYGKDTSIDSILGDLPPWAPWAVVGTSVVLIGALALRQPRREAR